MGLMLLLIGHFFGDFTLQTNKIAYMKTKSNKWLILHVAIVTLSTMIAAIPMGSNILILTFINGFVHFAIDWLKIHKFNKKERTIIYFFIDQGLHVSLLTLISLVPNKMTLIPASLEIRWLLCVLISLSVVNIITQFYLHDIFGSDRPFFYKKEVVAGHFEKLLILFGIFLYPIKFYAFLVVLFFSAFIIPLCSSKYVNEDLSLRYFQTKFLINYILIAVVYFICL